VADKDDPYIALADARTLSIASSRTSLVDYFLIVPSWMPGASFKRDGHEWGRLACEMRENQFKIVKQKMVSEAAEYILRCFRP
jgi:hypothetical protein